MAGCFVNLVKKAGSSLTTGCAWIYIKTELRFQSMGTVLALSIALFSCIIAIIVANSPNNPLSPKVNILLVLGCVFFFFAIVFYALKDAKIGPFDLLPSHSEENKVEEKTAEQKENTIEGEESEGTLITNQDQLHDKDVVQWTDSVFEKLVRAKIGKPTGPVYVEDLDFILDLTIYGDKLIFVNFEEQNEAGYRCRSSNVLTDYYTYKDSDGNTVYVNTLGEIRDISSLFYFRELYSLTIIANKINDISIIGSMPKITFIDVWGNQITDLSYIDGIEDDCGLNREQNISIGDTLDPIN